MTTTRSVDGFLALLDLSDGYRVAGQWPEAFEAAQAALDALPSDGSLTAEEHDELLLLGWLKRENASAGWYGSLRDGGEGRTDLVDPGRGAVAAKPADPDPLRRFRLGAVAVATMCCVTVSTSLVMLVIVLGAPAGQRVTLAGWGAGLLGCFVAAQILSLWWWKRLARASGTESPVVRACTEGDGR